MQSNNPFRSNEYAAPAPGANTYYAPPPGPPQVTDSKQSDQGNSFPEQPNSGLQPSLGYSPPPGQTPSYPPGPGAYGGQAMQQPQSSQWSSSLPPPPSYSAHPPPAPREMQPSPYCSPQPPMPPQRQTSPYSSQPYPPNAQSRPMSHSPGPSQPPPSGSGFMSNLKHRNPLDPPPESFSRPVPPHLYQGQVPNAPGYPGGGFPPLAPFPPMRLVSKDTTIDGGFPMLMPACSFQPHPFAQRDVMEADWIRFLEDIQITGRLSGGQRVAAQVLPMAMSVGFIGGIFVSRAIEKGMKRKKNEPTGELVDTWNDHFFHRRRLHVILAHGPENISGNVDGPAPDWTGGRSRSSSTSSSSSDSSSDDGHGRHGKLTGRDDRRRRRSERKADRRERKHERREDRRARKAERRQSKHEKYRLVIVSI